MLKLAAALGAITIAAASPARASFITVDTGGTINSGTDASGIFGRPNADLTGRAYTLSLSFEAPGDFTYASATEATSSGAALSRVSVTVGGVTFTDALLDSYGSFIELTPGEVTASNVGDDAAGNFLSITNQFAAAVARFPVGFYAPFTYTGTAADGPSNAGSPVSFSVSGALNASFAATPGSVSVAVPEAASASLLLFMLAGVPLLRRRPR